MSRSESAVELSQQLTPRWLPHLSLWPAEERLEGIDLNLRDRSRVSALPWRGQFSPETVERLLRVLASPSTTSLVDPFVGSGTSLIEAARRGVQATGLDVNPAAVAYARVATWAALTLDQRERRMADLAMWCNEAVSRSEEALVGELVLDSELTDKHTLALLAANPTPFSPAALADALARFESLVNSLPAKPVMVVARIGDARRTELPDNTFDFALTSPPYINVFNYHQYGRPLTDRLGWNVLDAARAEVGSNRQNRVNRFRTVVQYTLDMALALRELHRILADDATAVLVVGRESNVRGVPFFNGEILACVIEKLNLFDTRTRAERVFISRFGQTIFEDILILRDRRASGCSHEAALAAARDVAYGILSGCVGSSADIQKGLADALGSIRTIGPSPVKGAMWELGR